MRRYKCGERNASHFLTLLEIYMTNTVSVAEKFSVISTKCKDKELMDNLIETYQTSTKTAVENILNMCIAVKEIDEKRKAKLINDFDVTYFCASVSLDRKSPTFRKYRKIGEHADRFQKHMESLPSAYTVLFQIATLDADKFEELIETNQITPSLSLEKLKQITNTSAKNQNPDEVNFKVSFNASTLSDSSKDYVKRMLIDLMQLADIEVVVPEKHQLTLNYPKPTQTLIPKVVQSVNKTKLETL
jgi:hypothetical protein